MVWRGFDAIFAICTVLHLSRQHIQFCFASTLCLFQCPATMSKTPFTVNPHALFWSPHKGGLGKLPLAHMIGELFSRMAAVQGLRRGVHRAG
jgi:hypothetical protein